MPTLQARAAHGGHSGSTPLGDRGSDVVDEPVRVITNRGGEHAAGHDTRVMQLAVRDAHRSFGLDDIRSVHPRGPRVISAARAGP